MTAETAEQALVDRIDALRQAGPTPVMVAIDGRSGTGKSTLARPVAQRLGASLIEGDDFYRGGSAEYWDAMNAPEKVRHVIDWPRQHELLTVLRQGHSAHWYPYDWQADNGNLSPEPRDCPAADVIIIEGAYSARPELGDVLTLRVLLHAAAETRLERLLQREGDAYRADWLARWTEAEEHYFGTIMPPAAFDLVLLND